jgi:antitoxin HicB
MKYPVQFASDAITGSITITFRDIPEIFSHAATESQALDKASEILFRSIDACFDQRRTIPLPSKAQRGEHLIAVPASLASKVLLLNEMLAQKVIPSELARRLCTTRQEIHRLVDPNHTTKIDRVEEALAALGKKLKLSLV